MVIQPIPQDDSRLRQRCKPVTRQQLRRREQQQEIDALQGYFYGRSHGLHWQDEDVLLPKPSTVGLSANQVGIMKRICIIDFAIGRPRYHDARVLINPEITWQSQTLVQRVEGCVNFECWWGITRRPNRVKLTAFDRSGFQMTLDVSGWAAAVACHEIDHLNGRLFIDRLVDPAKVHVVTPQDYPVYRRRRSADWPKTVDLSEFVVQVG